MATYKKHGNKSKKKGSERIAQKSSTAKFFGKLDYGASLFEDWIARNQKVVLSIIGIVIIGVLGYLAYDNFIFKPRQEEAIKEISQPLEYFSHAMQVDPGADQDTLLLKSLNGAGSYGLLDIVDNYSGTDAANIAHYASGMAYLKLGKYEKAIDQLKKFSSDDEFYAAISIGAIGDAYSENNQPEKALNFYEKAAKIRKNDYTTPKFLFKAALTALDLNKSDKAKELLKQIKDNYSSSPEADKVPIYLGLAKNDKK